MRLALQGHVRAIEAFLYANSLLSRTLGPIALSGELLEERRREVEERRAAGIAYGPARTALVAEMVSDDRICYGRSITVGFGVWIAR